MKMRIENHINIQHIMVYHLKKGSITAQSVRDVNELFGEGTISKSQVEKWPTPSYSAQFLWVKHLAKPKPSFF